MRTNKEKSATAMALHERQRHYDELHHMMRLEFLFRHEKKRIPTSFTASEVLSLKKWSVECLRMIREHGMSTNSVDLHDLERLEELDKFEASRP